LLAVVDGGLDVGIGVTLEVRAEEDIAAEGIGLQRDVAGGNFVIIAGRQDEVFASFAFVDAEETGVLKRHLPKGDDIAGKGALVSGGRKIEDDGSVLGVEEGDE
jgi:hypothetical protein